MLSSRSLAALLLLLGFMLAGCASNWKIHGGPQECVQMCNKWGLVFAGMVGVGDQGATGEGATACVCQVPGTPATSGGNAAAASLAAPITAAQAAAAAQAAQQHQMHVHTGPQLR
jgi:hypothetical protein